MNSSVSNTIRSDEKTANSVVSFLPKMYIFKSADDKSRSEKAKSYFSQIIAPAFWIYIILNVFVMNVDLEVQRVLPVGLKWITEFKFPIVLVISSLIWLIFGTRDFIAFVIYVSCYPITKITKIIITVFKNSLRSHKWVVFFAAFDAIAHFGKTAKFKFITATVFLVSAIVIRYSSDSTYLVLAASTVLLFIFLVYIRSFIAAISPPSTFKMLSSALERDKDNRFKSFQLDEDLRGKAITQLSDQQMEKWNNSLQSSVIYNRGLLFLSKTLREYQKSNLPFLPGMLAILKLLLITVIGFAFINFALFKIDPNMYKILDAPGWFKFVYYSFNNLIVNGIDDVKPAKSLSQLLFMIQAFMSFFLAVILISLFLSHRVQRSSSDLDDAIKAAEKEAESIEAWMRDEYKMASINRAIEHLRLVEANMMKFIHWLSKGV